MAKEWPSREAALAWAACAIDGEGNIDTHKVVHRKRNMTWRLVVNVGNTDPRMAIELRQIFGFGAIFRDSHKFRGNRNGRFPMVHWSASARQAVCALEQVYPFLVLKRDQADVALAFYATMIPRGTKGQSGKRISPDVITKREELREQMRVLHNTRPSIEEVS